MALPLTFGQIPEWFKNSATSGAGGMMTGASGGEAIAGRNLISDPFGDVQAADKQYQGQKEALAQQAAIAQGMQDWLTARSDMGLDYIEQYGNQGAAYVERGGQQAQDYYGAGKSEALAGLTGSTNYAQNQLNQGYGQGRSNVAGGYGAARQDINQGYAAGRDALGSLANTQAINSYDAYGRSMLNQPGGLYGSFEQDPGYRFRQQQGEDAINRAASARGGRLSGRTLQELGEFNQGLASQEFGNYAARQQAQAGLESGYLQNQAGRADQAALAAQGYRAGALGQLGNMGMQYGQAQAGLSAAGGQALGDMAVQQGVAGAGLQSQYGSRLADVYGQFSGMQGNAAMQSGTNLGQLYSNMGSNMANTAIGTAGNQTSLSQGLMGAYGNFGNMAGLGAQAQANSNKETASMIMSFFSDERLKEDVETIPSKYELIGLRGVSWRWNDEAERLGLGGTRNTGVIAQEVIDVYPHAVIEGPFGYFMVNYGELDRLVDLARSAPEGEARAI